MHCCDREHPVGDVDCCTHCQCGVNVYETHYVHDGLIYCSTCAVTTMLAVKL